jgi:hypothetical protein
LTIHDDSYVLFSIGNNTALFDAAFKNCWTGKTCNKNWIAAISYMEVVGIIVGQILVGYLGDAYVPMMQRQLPPVQAYANFIRVVSVVAGV